mmetsp:Transcript_28863/g.72685  ORF Transcript_28863/g.72685 Transcript_28863/m.72685 type:complete len:311 (+) Transcript_28863:495-1427(+)
MWNSCASGSQSTSNCWLRICCESRVAVRVGRCGSMSRPRTRKQRLRRWFPSIGSTWGPTRTNRIQAWWTLEVLCLGSGRRTWPSALTARRALRPTLPTQASAKGRVRRCRSLGRRAASAWRTRVTLAFCLAVTPLRAASACFPRCAPGIVPTGPTVRCAAPPSLASLFTATRPAPSHQTQCTLLLLLNRIFQPQNMRPNALCRSVPWRIRWSCRRHKGKYGRHRHRGRQRRRLLQTYASPRTRLLQVHLRKSLSLMHQSWPVLPSPPYRREPAGLSSCKVHTGEEPFWLPFGLLGLIYVSCAGHGAFLLS